MKMGFMLNLACVAGGFCAQVVLFWWQSCERERQSPEGISEESLGSLNSKYNLGTVENS